MAQTETESTVVTYEVSRPPICAGPAATTYLFAPVTAMIIRFSAGAGAVVVEIDGCMTRLQVAWFVEADADPLERWPK
jgi:hypothetical protein